jgi:hypothetical protein
MAQLLKEIDTTLEKRDKIAWANSVVANEIFHESLYDMVGMKMLEDQSEKSKKMYKTRVGAAKKILDNP